MNKKKQKMLNVMIDHIENKNHPEDVRAPALENLIQRLVDEPD
jgi:hypothetical protein